MVDVLFLWIYCHCQLRICFFLFVRVLTFRVSFCSCGYTDLQIFDCIRDNLSSMNLSEQYNSNPIEWNNSFVLPLSMMSFSYEPLCYISQTK